MRQACLLASMKTNYLSFIQLRKTNFMLDYASLFALAAVVREGTGANVLGDPLDAFVWLVNALASQ